MKADELGALRIIAPVLRHTGVLRLRCRTCEEDARRSPVVVWDVPAGTYPTLDVTRDGPSESERYIILPFELERLRGHLLHHVVAECNGYWISFAPIHVQAWEREESQRIHLEAP